MIGSSLDTSCFFSQRQELIPSHIIASHAAFFRPLVKIKRRNHELGHVKCVSEGDWHFTISGNGGRLVRHIDGKHVRLEVRLDMRPGKIIKEDSIEEDGPFQVGLAELFNCSKVGVEGGQLGA